MSLSNLVRLLVKRDAKGDPVLAKGKPIPTWMTPVALHFWKADEPKTREENLWREVAARLTLDALGFTSVGNKSKQERVKAMSEAQALFRYSPEDAMLVFMAGGIQFAPVQDAVMKIIDEKDLFNESEEEIS
jgi:hypothetical protein